jgi:molecular chaperone HtpG
MAKKEFSADVAQLINLVTNSIYSNKDIFLRELLSNASDALAKAQFNGRSNSDYLGDDHALQITVDVDEDKKIITITDNGIGMTKEQVIEHIGTIAKS